jgi:hypothetical protein
MSSSGDARGRRHAHGETNEVDEQLLVDLLRDQAGINPNDLFNVAPPDEPLPPTFGEYSAAQANLYALRRIASYLTRPHDSLLYGQELFEEFTEDFEGWRTPDFNRLDKAVRNRLHKVLKQRDVWPDGRGRKDQQLMRLVELTPDGPLPTRPDGVPPERDDNFEDFLNRRKGRSEGSSRVSRHPSPIPATSPRRSGSPAATTVAAEATHPVTQTSLASQGITSDAQEPAPRVEQATKAPQTEPGHATSQAQEHASTEDTTRSSEGSDASRDLVTHETAYVTRALVTHEDPYFVLPPPTRRNEPPPATALSAFAKWWKKRDDYSGKAYDVLDDKVRRFYRACKAVELKPEHFHAAFPYILVDAAYERFAQHIHPNATFAEIYNDLQKHFDTEVNRMEYYSDWTNASFLNLRAKNSDKSDLEVLEILFEQLARTQRALGKAFQADEMIVQATLAACRGWPDFQLGFNAPGLKWQELCGRLRNSLKSAENARTRGAATYLTDRRYNSSSADKSSGNRRPERRPGAGPTRKWKCYVCGIEGCRMSKHPQKERDEAMQRYRLNKRTGVITGKSFSAFLASVEGFPNDSDESDQEPEEETEEEGGVCGHGESYFMSFAPRVQVAATHWLANQSFLHHATGYTPPPVGRLEKHQLVPANAFTLSGNSNAVFQGIMPDTGAATYSTGGMAQFRALQKWLPETHLDETRAGEARVRFGVGESLESLGAAAVVTPVGTFTFHIMTSQTPFLLCLDDMDDQGVYFDNTRDVLVHQAGHGERVAETPVIRRWGHAWFFLGPEASTAYLSEAQLRTLHTQLSHPSVDRLAKTLRRAGHDDFERKTLEEIKRVCHYCQVKGSAPRRWRFTLSDDKDFNAEIFVDVLYLSNRPVLHVVDAATAYNAARFLTSMTTEETWKTLKLCWIDTYLGPPDQITHDAGTNFASLEFKSTARTMGIVCREVPVEAHWSIGKVERYHAPLRRAYEIFDNELKGKVSDEQKLQMACKAINDTAGPDGLVPTLLVFGAMPRLTETSPPTPSTLARGKAVRKAMDELRKIQAERQVRDALRQTRDASKGELLPEELPIGLVWRGKEGWQGPFPIVSTTGTTVTVRMVNGEVDFRATSVQRYYREDRQDTEARAAAADEELPPPMEYPPPVLPNRRGRPPHTSAETEKTHQEVPARGRGTSSVPVPRPQNQLSPPPLPPPTKTQQQRTPETQTETQGMGQTTPNPPPRKSTRVRRHPKSKDLVGLVEADDAVIFLTEVEDAYMTKKENSDWELALQLRVEGKITTPGKLFEASMKREIEFPLSFLCFPMGRWAKRKDCLCWYYTWIHCPSLRTLCFRCLK